MARHETERPWFALRFGGSEKRDRPSRTSYYLFGCRARGKNTTALSGWRLFSPLKPTAVSKVRLVDAATSLQKTARGARDYGDYGRICRVPKSHLYAGAGVLPSVCHRKVRFASIH